MNPVVIAQVLTALAAVAGAVATAVSEHGVNWPAISTAVFAALAGLFTPRPKDTAPAVLEKKIERAYTLGAAAASARPLSSDELKAAVDQTQPRISLPSPSKE